MVTSSDTQQIIKEFMYICCNIIEIQEMKKVWKEYTNKDIIKRKELFNSS